jgi:hypothetical protein
MIALGLAVALAGCGRTDSGDQVAVGPADALTFVAGSGSKVAQAPSFRFAFENLDANEYNAACGVTLKWDAAMDTGRRLLFLAIRSSGEPTVILSSDTLYVKASVLPGWRIAKPWLSVPLSDAQSFHDVTTALGVSLSATFWDAQDRSNPTTALAAMKDSVKQVQPRGDEPVRGAATTHYDLEIDPARAGLWTGGTTTSTAPTASAPPSPADAARARRRWMVDQLTQDQAKKGRPPVPPDVAESFLNGDPRPLLTFEEHTSGTTVPSKDRLEIEALAADDPRTVTTDPEVEALIRALDAMAAGATGAAAFGSLMESFTSVSASVWVDRDGVLRRLEERVEVGAPGGSPPGTSAPGHPLLAVRLEFWAIGDAISESTPAPADVSAASTLSRATDIPERLSPCYWRIPDPGRGGSGAATTRR